MKALTLGGKYSFSDSATNRYLQMAGLSASIELLTPLNRTEGIIEEMIKRHEKGEKDVIAVVPVLNTLNGRVKDTIGSRRGLLEYYPKAKICGEYWLKIEQCLAGNGNIKDINKIISHPQALGQCSVYIEKLGIKTEEATSTSRAAEIASEDKTGGIAAICSEDAAKGYNLNLLGRDIGDKLGKNSENWTRFFALSYKDSEPTGCDKTTLTMELYGSERPGTLETVLKIFSVFETNISYINSIVMGSRTNYVFWLDVDKHRKHLRQELDRLRKISRKLRIHGSYPIHNVDG